MPKPAAARFVAEARVAGIVNVANLQAVLDIANRFGTPHIADSRPRD